MDWGESVSVEGLGKVCHALPEVSQGVPQTCLLVRRTSCGCRRTGCGATRCYPNCGDGPATGGTRSDGDDSLSLDFYFYAPVGSYLRLTATCSTIADAVVDDVTIPVGGRDYDTDHYTAVTLVPQ